LQKPSSPSSPINRDEPFLLPAYFAALNNSGGDYSIVFNEIVRIKYPLGNFFSGFFKELCMSISEREENAISMFLEHPQLFPESNRASILQGVATLGMAPLEVSMAGGAYSFRVVADIANWSANADPLKVIRAQSEQPDNSEIWMTFRNSTQYPDTPDAIFRVYFQKGRATAIERFEGSA
jgi:hypothetical protein